MFTKKNPMQQPGAITSCIGKGCVVKGDIVSDATIRVDGEVNGNVDARGGLILGEGAVMNGDIRSEGEVMIYGSLTGNVSARLVEIGDTGKLKGSVHTRGLVIANGAVYNGTMFMEDAVAEVSGESLAPAL